MQLTQKFNREGGCFRQLFPRGQSYHDICMLVIMFTVRKLSCYLHIELLGELFNLPWVKVTLVITTFSFG